MRSIKQIENYWKNPTSKNAPEGYLNGKERTEFLVGKVKKYLNPIKEQSILELGCNVGRNLYGLHELGFHKLYGIEINKEAIKLMLEKYPYINVNFRIGPVEDKIQPWESESIDLIFTMAVLCHIHPDVAETVFDNMVRVTRKYIITIENEIKPGRRHFVRCYKDVFEKRRMKEIDSKPCTGIQGLDKYYVYRVFEK
jgi:SAM-dependent methyltransferase